MNDPHLVCVGCERLEATTREPFCPACAQTLRNAGLVPATSTTPAGQVLQPLVQVGPTDV